MSPKALILLALALPCLAADTGAQIYQEGLRAERAGDHLHALLLYTRAAALDPSNPEILAHRNALQGLAPAPAAQTFETPPAPPRAEFTLELAPSERVMLPPTTLIPAPGTHSFNLQGPADTVIIQVAKEFGIQAVSENGYQGTPVTFRTGEMTMEEAFRALEASTNSLILPVTPHTAMIAKDTQQRRADSTPVMEASIPIPERMAPQEAQELLTGIQQVLELRRAQVDPLRRLVVIRDIASKVIAARQLFSDLSRLKAQVEIEVELLTVNKDSSLDIGLSLPTSSAIVNFGDFLHNIPSPGTFTKFLSFGAGKTLFGLGITDAATFATLSRNSATTVVRAQLTIVDGQPGQLTIGDHFPIQTTAYIGNTGGGQVYQPPPSINFEDLGLTLKVTPTVHDGGEMSLDIDAQFKVLGTGGANGIPDVLQRKFQSKVRLARNEWAVLAGLTQESDSYTSTGVAGLARIPWLGHLFRKDSTDKNSDNTLIVLKPRLVSLPPWEEPTATIWTGTDGKPISLY